MMEVMAYIRQWRLFSCPAIVDSVHSISERVQADRRRPSSHFSSPGKISPHLRLRRIAGCCRKVQQIWQSNCRLTGQPADCSVEQKSLVLFLIVIAKLFEESGICHDFIHCMKFCAQSFCDEILSVSHTIDGEDTQWCSLQIWKWHNKAWLSFVSFVS